MDDNEKLKNISKNVEFYWHASLYADTPYVLAFSLLMLHTDAFNKSVKRKMSKEEFVKNTRIDGVPPEILEVF